MVSKYVREQKRYSQQELKEIFECSSEETVQMIRKLKEYGVLKTVKKNTAQQDLSDLAETDVQITDVEKDDRDYYYVFSFVGIIVIRGVILKCYPKYILSVQEPKEQMKQILRVLEKYNAKEQTIHLYNEADEGGTFHFLAIVLYLLQDYFDNGIYMNDTDIVESNGNGEILWDKTINETFSLISEGRPYYMNLQTRKKIFDEREYFRRLHECILTILSKELEETDLPYLFNITPVELSQEKICDFGDTDEILYRIQNELNIQYNTRKQLVLKAIYAYVARQVGLSDMEGFSLFGSNSYNLVWEKVCAENFGNALEKRIGDLPFEISPEYADRKNEFLKNIIDTPVWYQKSSCAAVKADTLRPDLICIYPVEGEEGKVDYCFGIYDAKYYVINFEKHHNGWALTGQPGVEDITKQYLYQLGYDDFITKQGCKYVQNVFLCPQEEADTDYGFVEMQMLHMIGEKTLEDIGIVKLCAEEMYDIYLAGQKIEEAAKYIPNLSRRENFDQSFSGRMQAYVHGMMRENRKDGAEREIKQGKLIYPKQIKRELGAKLIYDAICPFASNIFYGFDPYEKEHESMAAESMGNTYERCNQIADVSVRIEENIKKLTEEDLKNGETVKETIRKCFEGFDAIGSMAEGRCLEKLTDRIMGFIRELYL